MKQKNPSHFCEGLLSGWQSKVRTFFEGRFSLD